MLPRPRSSGGKHYSLSIEAPITKVINIILAAQENQPSYIVQALDKVDFMQLLIERDGHLPVGKGLFKFLIIISISPFKIYFNSELIFHAVTRGI